MLLFKKIDLAGQVCLIVTGVIMALIKLDFEFTILGYLLVGGWQVLSFFIHVFFRSRYYPSRQRDYYGYTLLCLLLFAIPLMIGGGEGMIVFLVILMFISPALALWYATICDQEVKRLRDKMLVHLK